MNEEYIDLVVPGDEPEPTPDPTPAPTPQPTPEPTQDPIAYVDEEGRVWYFGEDVEEEEAAQEEEESASASVEFPDDFDFTVFSQIAQNQVIGTTIISFLITVILCFLIGSEVFKQWKQ